MPTTSFQIIYNVSFHFVRNIYMKETHKKGYEFVLELKWVPESDKVELFSN